MQKELENKLMRIFDCCKNVEKVVIVNSSQRDPNFTHLTGFKSGLYEGNVLVASRSGLRLYTNELEYGTAVAQRFNGLSVVEVKSRELRQLMKQEMAGKRMGINGSFMPYSAYRLIKARYKPEKITDVSECLVSARLVKDEYEIRNIKTAAKITKDAMLKIQKYFRKGITERELARKFDGISESLGSEGPSFSTIVCFGKNAAMPHHFPNDIRLKVGDFVLIDAGAKLNNYCSDITRTFVFRRNDKKKKEVYETVKKAQQIAIKAIRAGRKAKEIDGLARNYIDSASGGRYKGMFIHTLGHSLGVEVHDGGRLSKESDLTLKEGMVFTVEPGIYINGFGGVRIEDDIVVTKSGCKVL